MLSPGNTLKEMTKKQEFYDRYGVEEYYIYDPDRHDFNGLVRVEGQLRGIDEITDWRSPRLGIRFVLTEEMLEVYYPDGRRFLTTVELAAKAEQAEERAEQAELQLEEERSRSARLAEQLRSLGIDPDPV